MKIYGNQSQSKGKNIWRWLMDKQQMEVKNFLMKAYYMD